MANCPNCGTPVSATDVFCPSCGRSLSAASTAVPVGSVPEGVSAPVVGAIPPTTPVRNLTILWLLEIVLIIVSLFVIGFATYINLIVIIVSCIMVYRDAQSINRYKGRKVLSAGVWLVLVLFFSVITLPIYNFYSRKNALQRAI